MTLDELDPNDRRRRDGLLRGVRMSGRSPLMPHEDQAARRLLRDALAEGNAAVACYWLGRLLACGVRPQ